MLLFDPFPFFWPLCLTNLFYINIIWEGHIFPGLQLLKKNLQKDPQSELDIQPSDSYFVIMTDYPASHANKTVRGKKRCVWIAYLWQNEALGLCA